jgi:integrase
MAGKLTETQLRALKPENEGEWVKDEGGLQGQVRVTRKGIAVSMYYGFNVYDESGKRKRAWMVCGTWPGDSLKEIRAVRDQARQAVSDGIDPRAKKLADKLTQQQSIAEQLASEASRIAAQRTVGDLYADWLEKKVARSADSRAELERMWKKDMLPALAHIPVADVKANDLRNTLLAVAERGAPRVAEMLYEQARHMFIWADDQPHYRRLLIDGNPAKGFGLASVIERSHIKRSRERVLTPPELLALRDVLAAQTAEFATARDKRKARRPLALKTQYAIWVHLATMCRAEALTQAEWQYIDLNQGTWWVPPEHDKSDNQGRSTGYMIYLSAFAIAYFTALKAISGDSPYVFPSGIARGKGPIGTTAITVQITDRQRKFKAAGAKTKINRHMDDSLVIGTEKWHPHDLRRTGKTLMQQLEIPDEVSERCLGHTVGRKINRTYGRYTFDKERQAAFAKLGDYLDQLFGERPALSALSVQLEDVA